jgi:hypothetical protein
VAHRLLISLLVLLLAHASVASCICTAAACPMAEAAAAGAVDGEKHSAMGDGTAAMASGGMMDCCAGSGPAGIAAATDCTATELEGSEKVAEALPSALSMPICLAPQGAFHTVAPAAAGASTTALDLSPETSPPDSLIARHTSLLR